MSKKSDTEFDVSQIKDTSFYQVRLFKSTTLHGDALPAANTIRMGGSSVKEVAGAVLTAIEIEEDEKIDIMGDLSLGPSATS